MAVSDDPITMIIWQHTEFCTHTRVVTAAAMARRSQ